MAPTNTHGVIACDRFRLAMKSREAVIAFVTNRCLPKRIAVIVLLQTEMDSLAGLEKSCQKYTLGVYIRDTYSRDRVTVGHDLIPDSHPIFPWNPSI